MTDLICPPLPEGAEAEGCEHYDVVTHEAKGLIGLPPVVQLRSLDFTRTYDLIRDPFGRKVLAQRFKNLFPGHTVADIVTGQVVYNHTFRFQAE